MPLSDREVKNVLGFYVVLRNVVLIAGAAVIVAAVVAVIAGAYIIGRKNGNAEAAVAPSGLAKHTPKSKPRPASAKTQEEIEALEPQEEEGAAARTSATPGLGENDAKPTESAGETAPDRPDPLAVQRQDAAVASPAQTPAVTGTQTFMDAFDAPPSDTPPVFSVTARQKKHGWVRRFFGAIGRGLGKALGVR